MKTEASDPSPENEMPVEGDDAGPSHDYWEARKQQSIMGARTETASLFSAGVEALGSSPDVADDLVRRALRAGAESYWYAEGSEAAIAEHAKLHQIGRWARENIGCHLDFDGTSYKHTCPVILSDKRLGFSIGITAKRWCSICDGDFSECNHRRQRMYWVSGGPTTFGRCRVCQADECDHTPGNLYPAPAFGVIKSVDAFEEVSIVDVPAFPLSRLTDIPIDTNELRQKLGETFEVGMTVTCDHCLEPYHGLPENLHIADLDAQGQRQHEPRP